MRVTLTPYYRHLYLTAGQCPGCGCNAVGLTAGDASVIAEGVELCFCCARHNSPEDVAQILADLVAGAQEERDAREHR